MFCMPKKQAVYLAGRMDHEKGEGHEWRTSLTPLLESLGFRVLDPYKFEPRQLEGLRPGRLPEDIKHWTELRDSSNPDHQRRFLRYMRRIIKYDLHIIKNEADYIIVLWDEKCKDGAGTHAELTLAWDLGKPIFCVEAARLPNWARGCCEEVFSSFDELKWFLEDEFGKDSKVADSPSDKDS